MVPETIEFIKVHKTWTYQERKDFVATLPYERQRVRAGNILFSAFHSKSWSEAEVERYRELIIHFDGCTNIFQSSLDSLELRVERELETKHASSIVGLARMASIYQTDWAGIAR